MFKGAMGRCLLEDGLGRLGRGRRPGRARAAQAEVGERRADVDHNGALEGVLRRRGVEVVGRGEGVVARGTAVHGGLGTDLLVGRVEHHVARDRERLLQLLGEIARLGADGHFLGREVFVLVPFCVRKVPYHL